MSQDEIHAVATRTTPAEVQVPNTMPGLITWAVGKFGGAAIISFALSYGIIRIYTDMQVQTERQLADQKATNLQVMEMVRSQTLVQAELANALRDLAKKVEAKH